MVDAIDTREERDAIQANGEIYAIDNRSERYERPDMPSAGWAIDAEGTIRGRRAASDG